MSVAKEYLIFLSGAIGSIFIGMWISSQQIARMLGYPVEFNPLFYFWGHPIYSPEFLIWYFMYGSYAEAAFREAAHASLVGTIVGFVFIIIFAIVRVKKKKVSTSHGSARWATDQEIMKSGLLDRKGAVVGLMIPQNRTSFGNPKGFYFRHSGAEHIFITAPPRTGKGVGVIIPTLYAYEESVLVLDIKKENYEASAGHRKHTLGQYVIKFEPTADDGSSARYNPFHEIRVRTRHEMQDVQNLVELLMNPDGQKKEEGGASEHFNDTAANLLIGVILHLLYTDPKASLPRLAIMLSNTVNAETCEEDDEEEEDENEGIWPFIKDMLETNHGPQALFQEIYGQFMDDITTNHPIVGKTARDMLGMAFRERASTLTTAARRLRLFLDPIVASNMSDSDFKVADLMNRDKPVSFYMVSPPGEMMRVTLLFRMILNFIIQRLTVEMKYEAGEQVKMYKHRLLMILDEFPSLGKFDAIEKVFAFVPGYGIRAMIITQSVNQIYKLYGKNTSIIDNCRLRVVFTPNDIETAQWISKSLGNRTEIVENKSYQRGFFGALGNSVTISTSETSRALLDDGEVMQFPYEQEIVMLAGTRPIKAKKIAWYTDNNFKSKWIQAPSVSDRIPQESRDFSEVNIVHPSAEGERREVVPQRVYGATDQLEYDWEDD
jgi:type IV secretion system protein VirD4